VAGGVVRFIRGNAFIVAAIALPVLVAGFFILAAAVPRWTVPAPAYDFVFRASGPFDGSTRSLLDFNVRDGRLEITVRPAPKDGYVQPWGLFLFDHQAMTVRELPLGIPDSLPGGQPITITVDALGGHRIVPDATAPDGYELRTGRAEGGGLIGELFGMARYRQSIGLAKDGRIVPLVLPAPYRNPYEPVYPVGWIVDDER
jgi:hypothetical protein